MSEYLTLLDIELETGISAELLKPFMPILDRVCRLQAEKTLKNLREFECPYWDECDRESKQAAMRGEL